MSFPGTSQALACRAGVSLCAPSQLGCTLHLGWCPAKESLRPFKDSYSTLEGHTGQGGLGQKMIWHSPDMAQSWGA